MGDLLYFPGERTSKYLILLESSWQDFCCQKQALNLTDCGEWLSMWVLYGTFPVFKRATCFTRLQFLLWVLGLTVRSIPRSRLANPDGAFEYGAEREYASQFMCSK